MDTITVVLIVFYLGAVFATIKVTKYKLTPKSVAMLLVLILIAFLNGYAGYRI